MSKRDRGRKSSAQPPQATAPQAAELTMRVSRRHMRIGWWSLLIFLSLGMTLEAMHGFKFQWYVGEDNATRRLMWTLAHAHGTLLSLIHLAYSNTVEKLGATFGRFQTISSWSLALASLLLPGGFFAGGIVVHDGDPGLGILLVPVGGGFLFVAVFLTALAAQRASRS